MKKKESSSMFKQEFMLDNFYNRQRSNSFEIESPTTLQNRCSLTHSNYSHPADIDDLIDFE